jgi:hypothetical protein
MFRPVALLHSHSMLIDTTFSIDGVLGAFAFTMSVPLIIIGNGLGALVVRSLTVKGINTIKKYAFLKNGAMYSIYCLGLIMLFVLILGFLLGLLIIFLKGFLKMDCTFLDFGFLFNS